MKEENLIQFKKNGFKIKDVKKLAKELYGKDLDEFMDSLFALKEKTHETGIIEFSETFQKKLQKIDDIINNDEMFMASDSQKLETFKTNFKTVQNRFLIVQQYLMAEANVANHHKNIIDVSRRIHELDSITNLTEDEKNKVTFELIAGQKSCRDAYNEALAVLNEQKRTLKGFSIIDIRNDLLKDINNLDMSSKELALQTDSRDSIESIIKELRNDVALYDLESTKARDDFNILCEQYGIEYDASKDLSHELEEPSLDKPTQKKTASEESQSQELSTDRPSNDGPANYEPANDGPANDGPSNDGPSNDKPSNDGPSNDGPSNDGPSNDGPSNDGPSNDGPANDGPSNDGPSNDRPSNDGPSNDGPTYENTEPVGNKIKVVAKKSWEWIKTHKKQILIAAGITALVVASIIAFQALIPAITSMMESSYISTLSTSMVNNGILWHSSVAAEQAALHAANQAGASIINAITGASTSFDAVTGVWTIGGQSLASFASAAAETAAVASAKVASLTALTQGTVIGGLGLTGLGLILPNEKKSAEYKEIDKVIKNISRNIDNFQEEDVINQCNMIINYIHTSVHLSDKEKQVLLKKVERILKKLQKKAKKGKTLNNPVDSEENTLDVPNDEENIEEEILEEPVIDNDLGNNNDLDDPFADEEITESFGR